MTLHTLLKDLTDKDDVDLLTKSDAWLEAHRHELAASMNELSGQYAAVLTAQRLKRMLQQTNHVAVQRLVTDQNGQVEDIAISLMPLKEAIKALQFPGVTVGLSNASEQLHCWENDGYDVDTTAALRKPNN
jgi:hypothetical protein